MHSPASKQWFVKKLTNTAGVNCLQYLSLTWCYVIKLYCYHMDKMLNGDSQLHCSLQKKLTATFGQVLFVKFFP